MKKENERNIYANNFQKSVKFVDEPIGKPKNIDDSKKSILTKLRAQKMLSQRKQKTFDEIFKARKRLMMAKQFRQQKQDLISEKDSESDSEKDPRYPTFFFKQIDISDSEESEGDDSSMEKL